MNALASLAAVLGAPTLLDPAPRCFESQHTQTPLFASTTPTLTLEVMDWDSSALATRVAEILLREKLGYTVRLVKYTDPSEKGTTYAYGRVASGEVSLNFELWRSDQDVYDAALADGALELSDVGFKGQR